MNQLLNFYEDFMKLTEPFWDWFSYLFAWVVVLLLPFSIFFIGKDFVRYYSGQMSAEEENNFKKQWSDTWHGGGGAD
tara:strand:+ start:94 stop:324 length:231 start_codon:yes stop_codon:yes gene_type:complete